MKQTEYIEGPEAAKNFERLATAIFKVPKAKARGTGKKSSKNASERKPKTSGKE